MNRTLELSLLAKLSEKIQDPPHGLGGGSARQSEARDALIPVEPYRSPERLAAEQRHLFRELPLVVGHGSEMPNPGDFLTHDATGIPLLLVRQADGTVRAFLNVCRHRGARLVGEPQGHARAFSCPYHAWTYKTCGALSRIPQSETFPSLQEQGAGPGLVRVPVAERFGLLWAIPKAGDARFDIDAWLGPVAEELAGFDLEHHYVYRKHEDRRAANWKLLVDAFLEGYHVRSLHRNTLARFFVDGPTIAEALCPHSRSIGARTSFLEARTQPRESWQLRELTTLFYHLFPNTILVFHPDWITLLSIYPDGVDRLIYSHRMLIPELPTTDRQKEHWDKTFGLIQDTVFHREDVAIAESIQSGLAAGADTHFRIGTGELAVKWFHDEIERRLRAE